MDDVLAMLHPPGWTLWQTIGTGVSLTIGHVIGKFVIDALSNIAARARK